MTTKEEDEDDEKKTKKRRRQRANDFSLKPFEKWRLIVARV